MTTKNLTVAVTVTGNASSLNAALTGSQSAATKLGQAMQAAARQKAASSQGQLAYLRSPAGAQATITNMRFAKEISNTTNRLQRVADHGRFGAAMMNAQDRAAPFMSAARTGAAVGGGLVAAGVASLPDLTSQLTGSMAMLSREIGIAVTPGVVRLSGVFQRLSRDVRGVNAATGGHGGDALFWGTAGIGGLGVAASFLGTNPVGWGIAAALAVPAAAGLFGAYVVPPMITGVGNQIAQNATAQAALNRPGPMGGFLSGLLSGFMGYGEPNANAPSLQIDRQPQMGDLTSLYDQILMGAVGKTPEQAEQENRALEALIASIDALNATIENANPPQPP